MRRVRTWLEFAARNDSTTRRWVPKLLFLCVCVVNVDSRSRFYVPNILTSSQFIFETFWIFWDWKFAYPRRIELVTHFVMSGLLSSSLMYRFIVFFQILKKISFAVCETVSDRLAPRYPACIVLGILAIRRERLEWKKRNIFIKKKFWRQGEFCKTWNIV